jgi:uncharacterized membrane protein YeaQ/YmgE (transglycosylase-associated protein family)
MLNVIGALFSGLFVGALARWFYPGSVHMGWFMTALLGVAGSLLAGLVVGAGTPQGLRDGLNRAGCLASVVGAMVVIFLTRNLALHW